MTASRTQARRLTSIAALAAAGAVTATTFAAPATAAAKPAPREAVLNQVVEVYEDLQRTEVSNTASVEKVISAALGSSKVRVYVGGGESDEVCLVGVPTKEQASRGVRGVVWDLQYGKGITFIPAHVPHARWRTWLTNNASGSACAGTIGDPVGRSEKRERAWLLADASMLGFWLEMKAAESGAYPEQLPAEITDDLSGTVESYDPQTGKFCLAGRAGAVALGAAGSGGQLVEDTGCDNASAVRSLRAEAGVILAQVAAHHARTGNELVSWSEFVAESGYQLPDGVEVESFTGWFDGEVWQMEIVLPGQARVRVVNAGGEHIIDATEDHERL